MNDESQTPHAATQEPVQVGDPRQAPPQDAPPAEKSQFALLGSRRLAPLFITQFLGAFNDNLFRAGLLLILVYGGLVADTQVNLYTNIAAGLFILPFFLFSAVAGNLSDRLEKSRLVRGIKLAEIVIAGCAGLALFSGNVVFLLLVLFLLGLQSTFFGPLKFAMLPQHLTSAELVGGNALVQTGTFVAILLGTIAGGVLGGAQQVSLWLFALVVAVALGGYLASRGIPVAPPAQPGAGRAEVIGILASPLRQTWQLLAIARERRAVFLSILGISWFWLLGSVYLTQIPNLTKLHLYGGPSVVTVILVFFTIAIAAGSLLCERLSGHWIEIGLVPLGAAGVSIFGIDAYFALTGIEGAIEAAVEATPERDAIAFLTGTGTVRVLVDLGLMGMFAGMFVVPLQATIQSRTPEDRRARVIAANNILNALLMVLGSVLAIVWLEILQWSIPSLFLGLSVLNLVVSVYIFNQVPEFTMRFIIWLAGHTIYRIRGENLHRIPLHGGACIVSNHVSYVDALLLAGAVRKPIRFIMHKYIYDIPILNFVFRTGRTVPIASQKDDPEAFEAAFDEVRKGLEAGDLFCIFPEGRLTPDGDIGIFRAGIERIVEQTPVPVIPVALRGLWGSFFSPEGAGTLLGVPRRFRWLRRLRQSAEARKSWYFRRRVEIVAGDVMPPGEVSAERLQDMVQALRGQRR